MNLQKIAELLIFPFSHCSGVYQAKLIIQHYSQTFEKSSFQQRMES